MTPSYSAFDAWCATAVKDSLALKVNVTNLTRRVLLRAAAHVAHRAGRRAAPLHSPSTPPIERMLITIPGVLTAEQVAACTAQLAAASWADGRESAGYLSQASRTIRSSPIRTPSGAQLGDTILRALEKSRCFSPRRCR